VASLAYVGKPIGSSTSTLAYKGYLDQEKAKALTQAQVDTRINELLTGYATKLEVDTGDAGAATLAYVDQQDALRIPLSWKGVANGVATLTSGKVTSSQVTVTGTQRLIKKMYSPSTYGSQQTVTGEITLYTVTIADPGYAYRVQAYGWANTMASAVLRARLNGTAGTIIAQGYSRQSTAGWSECTLIPYNFGEVCTGTSTVYFRALRVGSGTSVTVASLLANAYVQVIPA